MDEGPDTEKPTPRGPSPEELLYEIANAGWTPARPGGTTSGIDNAASPVSVTENAAGIVPASVVFDVMGGEIVRDARCERQARNVRFGGSPVDSQAQPDCATTHARKRPRGIHARQPTMKNTKSRWANVDDVIRVRPFERSRGQPLRAMYRSDNPTKSRYAHHENAGQANILVGRTWIVLCKQWRNEGRCG